LKVSASGKLTADQVAAVIVALAKIDLTNLKVTGPFETKEERVVRYEVTFCSDANVDSTKSYESFNDLVEAGNTGDLEVTDEPTDGPAAPVVENSASKMVASFALLGVAAALL
jgi:phage terminase large subunit-like protein